MDTPHSGPPRSGILAPGLAATTVGSFVLVFLAAFESLAVTTIMPVVSAELGGAQLYALAFAGPLAAGVVGMVAAGAWADRTGPTGPLYAASLLFSAGLLVCGLAPGMEVLVAGRLLQGLGGGGITVALYVVVARIYPGALHPQIFAAFAAAWVVPSMIGPFVAGTTAETVGWRWVFLGVVVLVAAALLLVRPSLAALPPRPAPESRPLPDPRPGEAAPGRAGAGATRPRTRLLWSVLAAVAVLALDRVGALPWPAALWSVAAAAAALAALRRLVPPGTLTARRGLPTVILVRGAVSAGFLGAEVYLPYLLMERYAFPASLAGLALTGAALSWAGASAVQGRLGGRLDHTRAVAGGALLVLTGITGVLATTLLGWPAAVAIAAWTVAGAGMGLMYPRLSVMTLAASPPGQQGANSSALSIADSMGAALALALTGIVFAAVPAAPFAAVFLFATAIALGAALAAPRTRAAATAGPGVAPGG
ncbi:MFS transporter [Zafaria sp. Z1313]|uniref:MFS transporter n=1 Tax=Zafaria sp. Z1313 TaxID=3423202 RepID=UPI003D302778